MADDAKKARICIRYCVQCQWLLRAAWIAQELLTTFPDSLAEVALARGSGGVCDDALVWDRKADGGFPDVRTLKQCVRDQLDAGRHLGNIDRDGAPEPRPIVPSKL